MKNQLFFAACLTTLLIGCDATSVESVTTGDNGSGNGDTTTPDATDTTDTTDTSNGTGLDGVTTASTTDGLVNSVGLMKLEPIGVTVDSTRGVFGDLSETLDEQVVRDWYIPTADVCRVSRLGDDTDTPEGFLVVDQIATQVSAGDSIVLTDENGTYATLQRTENETGPIYLPEAEIAQAAGAGLTVDISGDDFQAFPSVAVPPAPELLISRPGAGESVGVATFFQWQPNNVPGSTIELFTGGFSSVTNEGLFIACGLVDDGAFTFPEELQAQMGPDFSSGFTTLLRVVYNVAAEDDSILFVANSVRNKLQE